MISARTKAVLAAAKRRGVKLGRDPWSSIDGQGTSNWVRTGAQPAFAGPLAINICRDNGHNGGAPHRKTAAMAPLTHNRPRPGRRREGRQIVFRAPVHRSNPA